MGPRGRCRARRAGCRRGLRGPRPAATPCGAGGASRECTCSARQFLCGRPRRPSDGRGGARSRAPPGTLVARAMSIRLHRDSSIAKAAQDWGRRELHTKLSTGVDNGGCYRGRGVLRAKRAKPAANVSSGSDESAAATSPDASRSPGVSPAIPKIAGSVRTARYHTVKHARKRVRILTCQRAVSTLRRFHDRRKEFLHEADVPAEQAPPEEDPWLPGADEDTGWTEGPQATAGEGTQASHRLAVLL